MMNDFRSFEPDEQDLPEGWSPEAPIDPQLASIIRLARQAESPAPVPPARFQAMQMDVRARLLKEGLLKANPAPETRGVIAWLKGLLISPAPGWQMARLGAAAVLAFTVGIQFSGSDEAGSAVAETPELKSPLVANAVEKPSPAGGLRINKGMPATETRSPEWVDTIPRSGPPAAFMNNRVQAVPVGIATNSGDGTVSNDLAGQALEQLQLIKFYSVVDQDERQLAEIRRMEQTLAALAGGGQQTMATASRDQALAAYRQGEQLAAARRHGDALAAFDRAFQLSPDNSLGFLALFQVGRLAFDHLHDYGLALESFRRFQDGAPMSLLTPQNVSYLADHIRILSETSAEEWASIRSWHQARETTSPDEAAALYARVICDSPSMLLALDASNRLRDLLLTDSGVSPAQVESSLRSFSDRVGTSAAGVHTARIQFNLAEVLARRSPDREAVAAAYSRVLELQPDEALLSATRARLN